MTELDFQEQAQAPEASAAQEVKPKNKGGRPKGSKNKSAATDVPPQTPPAAEPAATTSKEGLFSRIRNDVQANKERLDQKAAEASAAAQPEGGAPQPSGVEELRGTMRQIIDGYLLMTILDTVAPWLVQKFFKQYRGVNTKEIRLDKDQKEHLMPLADIVAKDFVDFVDPRLLFFGLYFMQTFNNASEALEAKTLNK